MVCSLSQTHNQYLMTRVSEIQKTLKLDKTHLAALGLNEWEFYAMDAEMKQLSVKRPIKLAVKA